MQVGITLLIVGSSREGRLKKLDEILDNFFPQKEGRFNPNVVKLSGSIGIGEVRDLKLALSQKPYSANIQIGVIEVTDITIEAQSALLKLIEEPGNSTQVVILVENLGKLLPTVVSRCNVIFTTDRRTEIISEINLKDAKTIAGDEISEKFTRAAGLQTKEAVNWCEEQIILWHQVFLIKLGAVKKQNKKILEITKKTTLTKTFKILKNLQYVLGLLKLNVNSQLLLENFFLAVND